MSKKSQSISKLSDEEVVTLVRDEDPELYSEIVDRYQAKLLRYVNSFVRDDDKAADVVQNVFIKAYVNLNSFNVDKKFSSWIYRIAHNESINYIKKYRREVKPDDEEWFDRLPSGGKLVNDEVDAKLLKSKLAEHIDELPIKYREPIVLHYFEGHSYQEMSEVLHLPVATVGTRLNRGKAQLKKLLKSDGIDYEW